MMEHVHASHLQNIEDVWPEFDGEMTLQLQIFLQRRLQGQKFLVQGV